MRKFHAMLVIKEGTLLIWSNEGDIDIFTERNIATDQYVCRLGKTEHTEYNLRIVPLLLYSQADIVENMAILRCFDMI